MRILLTGATGFVGQPLCARLGQLGHTLVVLSSSLTPGDASRRGFERIHVWNATEAPPAPKCFEGVDAIIHLAGESVVGRWTKAKRAAIAESRLLGTRHLVDGLAQSQGRVGVLISASAIGYYGDRGDEDLVETSAPGDDFLASVSRGWESESQRAAELELRVVGLRIGIVLERGGGALGAMMAPARMGLGGPLGSGRQWWSWIHRDDLVGMIVWALENESCAGLYNATAPHPSRQADFARTLGKLLRRPALLPAPAFALKLMLGGFASELLSSKKVLPARALQEGFGFEHQNLEAALRNILED